MIIVSTIKANQNQIQQGVFHVLGSAPASPVAGQFYWDSALLAPRWYDGTGWTSKATDSALLNGQNAAYYLARANHSGTQLAATISDLATTVQGYKLNQFAAPNANIPMAGFTFTGLNTAPNAAGQAAEYSWVLAQVSAAASGVKAIKDPVRCLFAVQTTLSGIPTTGAADGLTLAAGDRVLVTGNTTQSENRIWLVQSGAWTAPTDFNASSQVEPGTEVLVQEGTLYTGTVWRITNATAITLGTTAITWQQINKINTYTAGNGLLLTGVSFAVVAVANGGITVSGAGVSVDRTVVPNRYATTIGDGSTITFGITHNLNTLDVMPICREISTGFILYPDYTITAVNTLTVTFGGYVPAANNIRITVIG